MESLLKKTSNTPGPNFQKLFECIFCNRRCTIVWDNGSVDPENPLINKPRGLYVTANSIQTFVSAEDLVANLVAEED
jgi:hypothetical protein